MLTAADALKPTQDAVIAIDLGGTKLASGVFAEDGRPKQKRIVPLEYRHGASVGELVVAEIRRLQPEIARCGMELKGVGVSVPGIADAQSGRVWAPNIPGWTDYPLGDEVRAAIADENVNVIVDSDRAACILGEAWQGAARGCRDAVFLAVGTGIGAGILADGRIVQGAHGIAGAIGWLALDRPFRPEYKECGCFESHASGEGLARTAESLLAQNSSYQGPLRDKFELTAHDLFAGYESGDEFAMQVLVQAVEFWGMASANLVSLLNPEKIIFGGGVFGPATRFLEAIAVEARRWAQPVSMARVAFEASQLGSDAALYGAACLARRQGSQPPMLSQPPRAEIDVNAARYQ